MQPTGRLFEEVTMEWWGCLERERERGRWCESGVRVCHFVGYLGWWTMEFYMYSFQFNLLFTKIDWNLSRHKKGRPTRIK